MKKVTAILFFILVLFISVGPLTSLNVFAASNPYNFNGGTINFINHDQLTLTINSSSNISTLSGTYTSNSNSALNYYSSSNSGSCSSKTHIAYKQNSWMLDYYQRGGPSHYGSSSCYLYSISIPQGSLKNTSNFNNIYFKFINSGQISATDNTHVFNLTSNQNGQATFSYNDSGCISTFITNSYVNNTSSNQLRDGVAASTNNSAANQIPITSGQLTVSTPTKKLPGVESHSTGNLYQIYNPPFGSGWPKYIKTPESQANFSPCSTAKISQPIQIQDPTINGKLATALNNPNASTTTSSSSSSSQGLSCGFSLNPLNFVFCGLIKLGLTVVSAINNIIYSELNLGTCSSGQSASSAPNKIFGSCSHNGSTVSSDYHAAWNSFRDIALALLVIMTLVILIAQGIKG